jgi:acyl-CoA dehydrogenase
MRDGDHYVVNGRKIYISRVQHSDLMILLARTTPLDRVTRKSDGLSVFLIDLREAAGNGLTLKPRRVMINNETNELLFENLSIPASSLIGEEGRGFRYILDSMNAERILIASECIGNGRWFVDKATRCATERVVFGRPIGQNQGIQFPIARAHISVEAADLMRFSAAELFDGGEPCGAEANMALLLTADTSWEAANAAMQTFGGYSYDPLHRRADGAGRRTALGGGPDRGDDRGEQAGLGARQDRSPATTPDVGGARMDLCLGVVSAKPRLQRS